MDLITTTDLCKRYGSKMVISHVNMHIPEQAIYGFVGENGSGKTTIMRLLTGLAEPTSGSFTLFGVENKDGRIYEVREQVSAIVENTSLIPTMTARDNMIYQELYLGISQTEEQRMELLRKVHLEDVGNKKVKNFSLGMRQRLGIALALMSHPKLMLLDEPMNGLDPEGIAELRDLLIELNQKEGITVLISSHILSELEKIASCYGFISHGRLLEEITAEELQDKCRKSLNIKVDDVKMADDIIKSLNIQDYKVYPNGDVKIFENVKINDIVLALSSNGVNVLGINSADESVEDYYLNLIKEGE
ncbi:MAG: ATP-binding cassette domain-containing protein [Bacilli bacterium]|nr:ATP-binding cassette domain-containing protein [Bacilli bacterium]